MAPESFTMNEGDTKSFDAGLASVQVGVGSVIVTDGHDSTVVEADTDTDTFDCEGKPSLALYSPNGAVLAVTYQDEIQVAPEPPHGVTAVSERGDTGGNGGSYESRTLEELRELASERNIKGRAGLSKSQLIEALRA